MALVAGPTHANAHEPRDDGNDRLVFVGTGVSTGIPVIGHLGNDCACANAIAEPKGPNRRNNVSLLVQLKNGANLLIDVGKTFRDAYFRTLQPRGVNTVDAIFITHDHADAIGGMDDLRDLQHHRQNDDKTFTCTDPISVYLSDVTRDTLNKSVEYIMRESKLAGPAHEQPKDEMHEIQLTRRVACLKLHMIDDQRVRPMVLPRAFAAVPFFSLPVFHGGSYRSMCYCFGGGAVGRQGEDCVVYMSDVSAVPEESLQFLASLPCGIDVLIIDMLLLDKDHFSHFSVKNAWDLALQLRPRRTYGIGMYCEIEHHTTNAMLAEWVAAHRLATPGTRIEAVELAFDGLEFEARLS